MPVVALALFLIWPLSVAGPVYAVILVLSLLLYAAVFRMMRKPVVTGREGLVHVSGVVERGDGHMLSVRVRGEHWKAHCDDDELEAGDPVEIVGVDGLTLEVKRSRD